MRTRSGPKVHVLYRKEDLDGVRVEGKVVVVDQWNFATPKTKDAVAALASLGVDGKALVVVDRDDINTIKSFLNLRAVQLIERAELNAYDILCNEWIVFSKATLPGHTEAEVAAAPAKATKKATTSSIRSADNSRVIRSLVATSRALAAGKNEIAARTPVDRWKAANTPPPRRGASTPSTFQCWPTVSGQRGAPS